ncbi:MAG TPA: rod shape-determining protein MreD [Lacibacter sp.]|nr:rod shape-determining protein MreD [Lacibacter sp.]HMO88741.1 rod shape-determining protein MreD [Lacibacter sp.]HMP85979.1 rod shape-determining protein MreD [Lacibacter sp.]
MILLILLQVFVLYQVPPLHYYLSPILYFVFILWLPFTIGRSSLLLVSFITGILLDFFTKTPGMHAAACVLIGYLRPFLVNILLPQQGVEFNYREPSVTSLGLVPYITYVVVLTMVHHAALFVIQVFQFGNPGYLLLKTAGSTLLSLLLIFIVELIFTRKQKFITNT